jgi:L-cysteine/cystine lyase
MTPEHVAVTASTTTGCHIVLSGLALDDGDEIVTTDEEHFGLLGPLYVSGARVRVAETRGRSGDEALAAVLAEVGPRTRLIALSHVSWMTGHVLPIDAIKAETGLPLLVDGAQSVGAIPVDVGAADFYTVSGQKWLCGPDATGALYVRDPDALAVALPSYWSREAHGLDGSFEPVEGARRFDTGPIPVPSLAGLETALRIVPPSCFDDAREITDRCRELLLGRVDVVTVPGQATLVTFRPHVDAADTVARLYDAGVVVRDIPETGWVRVSCGYWNTDEHLQRLADAVT